MKRLSIATLFVLFAFAGHAQINKGESFIDGSLSSLLVHQAHVFQVGAGYSYAVKNNRLLGVGVGYNDISGNATSFNFGPNFAWNFSLGEKLFWGVGAFSTISFTGGNDAYVNDVLIGVSLPSLGYRIHDRIILKLHTGSLSYGFKSEALQLSGSLSGLGIGGQLRLGKKPE
ncbi:MULTISPECIES: hypothetical protein [unclassified Imperialibacter]|uniref:hypothetical protein n=1 Tax=unclassified Imperialibacter TaxID=2629706 RepID=UPI00125F0038|nr:MULTISPECIES: hypothetical protein [unclassified Imperialibacter]